MASPVVSAKGKKVLRRQARAPWPIIRPTSKPPSRPRGDHQTRPSHYLPARKVLDLAKVTRISKLSLSKALDALASLRAEGLGQETISRSSPDRAPCRWSPRIVDLSKYPRNMLKLMAKMGGSTKKIADNLIGQREVPSASRLGVFMAAKKRKPGSRDAFLTKLRSNDFLRPSRLGTGNGYATSY